MASARSTGRRPASPSRRRLPIILATAALCVAAACACAAPGPEPSAPATPPAGDKDHVLDGSAVVTAGRLYLNVTNWGLLGSRYTEISSYSDAPSGQWPGGSSDEYIFAAGLWVGGNLGGELCVSTGQPEAEFRPAAGPRATIYEAREGRVVRPSGNPGASGARFFQSGGDDDGDGRVDEEILDGIDQDHDGLIDEDFGQLGTQMLVASMRDDEELSRALFPDHKPMHIGVVQRVFSWQTEEEQDFVVVSYELQNKGAEAIADVYLGFWMDGDIGTHADYSGGRNDLAGGFDGYVRHPLGHYSPVHVAWMHDGAQTNPLPGWCGISLVDHTTDPAGIAAPRSVEMNACRIISAAGAVGGGPPTTDAERYGLMSDPGRDDDVEPHQTGDYRVLVSAGPFPLMEPGDVLNFEVAICMGAGYDEMLDTCAEAVYARFGRWVDLDANDNTGSSGHETLICAEDFYPTWTDPANPVYLMNSDFWDRSCTDPHAFILPNITPGSFTYYPEIRKHCMYVNADICDECARVNGWDCRANLSLGNWACWNPPEWMKGACTGIDGKETPVPWAVDNAPPPAPSLRIVPGDGHVELFWDDRSERARDDITDIVDFESYRVWRADNWDRPPGSSERTGPPRTSWHLLQEYDLVNQYTVWYETPDGPFPRTLELGQNTGLEPAAYVPVCLNDPRYAGLSAAMHAVVLGDSSGTYAYRPPLRTVLGDPVPELAGLLPWEDYPAVLDTFFEVIARPEAPGVVPKPRTRYYHYVDATVTNGFLYFYAVTTTDHTTGTIFGFPYISGPGTTGVPGATFTFAEPRRRPVPAALAEQERAFAYPNPATRESLAEFQALHPTAGDPTGVRIAFANLPPVRCEIQIFGLAGDLVQTIEHDGSRGDGQAYWNLMTRNKQEIVSGIYLFVVVPLEPGHERQVGKFVVIR